jgi:hypothetical protein
MTRRGFAVERFELIEIHFLDIAADAAFSEAERHPRLESLDYARFHLGMLVEIEVQAVGIRVHQGLEPRGARGVLLLQRVGLDEELHAQILINFRFAFGLRQPAHRIDVVGFHAIEIVLGLRVDRAEDGVGISLSVDVRDAPVITNDGDIASLLLPARDVLVFGCLEREGSAGDGDDDNKLRHIQSDDTRVRASARAFGDSQMLTDRLRLHVEHDAFLRGLGDGYRHAGFAATVQRSSIVDVAWRIIQPCDQDIFAWRDAAELKAAVLVGRSFAVCL